MFFCGAQFVPNKDNRDFVSSTIELDRLPYKKSIEEKELAMLPRLTYKI